MAKGTLSFIVNEDTHVYELDKGIPVESNIVLRVGTIVKGDLKTKVIALNGDKQAMKVISLEKGFISPQAVNIYLNEFAHISGKSTTPVKKTAFGEQKTKATWKDSALTYGLPIVGAFIGYKISERMGHDISKKILFTLGFGLLGLAPSYLLKHKK